MRNPIAQKRSPYAQRVGRMDFVVDAETGNSITVHGQLKNTRGRDMASRSTLSWYLSDDANGDTLAASAPSSGIAAGTDGLLVEYVADKAGILTTEADGDMDFVVQESSAKSFYLVVVMPDGSRSVATLAFA